MMTAVSRSCFVVLIALAVAPLLAGQPASGALGGRTVSLTKRGLSLADALTTFKDQTGIEIRDMRVVKSSQQLNLNLERTPFWQALDALARQADARVSVYQPDGKVALVGGPNRELPVSYDGIFRIQVRRLVLFRDLDTGIDTCTIHLETAWEPWFRPFYFEAGPSIAGYSVGRKPVTATTPSQGKESVIGRLAVETRLRIAAPPRAVAKIDTLKGSFKVVGPSKMLAFQFENLKADPKGANPRTMKQEGVTVKLVRVERQPDRWSFDLSIENPPGGPAFESYQSWLDNNEILLHKGEGKARQVLRHKPEDEESLENLTATRAAIRYHFRPARQEKLDGWNLTYTTPGRIVEATAEYSFRDLPLP